MAKKPFYSLEEVCARLGKDEEEIKALVRSGDLREFRDAGKVFFKVEDIDKLAGGPEEGAADASEDTGDLVLEPGDEAPTEEPSLSEEASGGTSIIGLEPLEDEASEPEAEPASSDEGQKKKKKEDTVITASGIGVFDDDELEIDADPMAKTQITTGATEDDQITLEGAGSGSGLLDLAREADDTALGADLLDEIYPGEEDAGGGEEPAAEAEEEEAVPAAAEPEEPEEAEEAFEEAEAVAAPTVAATVPVGDPSEGIFTGLLVGGLIVMAAAMTVVGGVLQGFLPTFARWLADGTNFYIFLGGAAGVLIIALVVGWLLGRTFTPKRVRTV